MKHVAALAIGLVAVCAATTAHAQEKKFIVGLRTGYSLPMGNAIGSGTINYAGTTLAIPNASSMSDNFKYQVPIWIDAGYMVTPNLMLGVYFQYGFVGIKQGAANSNNTLTLCDAGASCSAHDIHYGIQAQYFFMPWQPVNPWLGLGIGRESMSFSETAAGQTIDGSLSGWAFATLQGGLDLGVADGFGLGPFVSLSLAQYSSVHEQQGDVGADINVPTSMHEWLTFGVRGAFGF